MQQFVCSDYGMCGNVRLNWPAYVLQGYGWDILATNRILLGLDTDRILVQRCAEKQSFDILAKFPNTTKRILDYDDLVFGSGLPSYNFVKDEYDIGSMTKAIADGLSIVDEVRVSTECLADSFKDTFRGYTNVRVVQNYLPRFLFGSTSRKSIRKDITNPTILYSGSSTHYSDTDTGDFSKDLVTTLLEHSDDITLVFLGKCPPFLKDIEHKCLVLPFVSNLDYPRVISAIKPDFLLAPLKENAFNCCKSNLKYLEGCAIGAITIGSMFVNSPYTCIPDQAKITNDMSSKTIWDTIQGLCKKDNYNRTLTEQYTWMDQYGWLEDHILEWD